MNRELLTRVLAELEPLLELPEDAAERRLAELSGRDPALADALARALKADREGGSLFDYELKLDFPEHQESDARPGLHPGLRIGPWRLRRELGSGGMGRVWLARRADEHYEVEVAIKFVEGAGRDSIASEQMRQERQILAGLDHPNIARLVDGGVRDDGTPWYAMEYVRGQPLDRYCAERAPELREKLALIATVARSLHHAHQRLIVHRDLKPGNILVDETGEPHLLDFGIAKLLGDDAQGRPGAMTLLAAATPEYAAPEQRRGEPVGTTADVFALGVILFELITGRRPALDFWKPSSASGRGPLPSESLSGARALRRPVRGDIDSIVSQALAPATSARYASAEALADDIDNLLAGRPVAARRAGAGYRTAKFVRRHWLGVGFGAAATLALCLALAFSLVQTDRAEQALARANAVQRFLIGVFDAAEPGNYADGLVVPRRDLAERAAEQLDGMLEHQPESRVELLIAVGRILRQLGFPERARPPLEQALDELDRAPGSRGDAARLEALFELGQIHSLDERMAMAARSLREADSIAAELESPPVARAAILFQLARTLSDQREIEPALDALEQAARLANHRDASLELLPRIRLMTALTLDRAGRTDEAITVGEQAVDDARRILGPMHDRTGSAMSTLGGILRRGGRLDEAERMHREAVRIGIEGYGSPNPAAVNNLAALLRDQGRFVDAARWQRQALDLAAASFGDESATTARYRRALGLYQAGSGRVPEAIETLERAWRDHAADAGPEHPNSRLLRAQLARVLIGDGRLQAARDHVDALLPGDENSPENTPRAMVLTHLAAAALALAERDPDAAIKHIDVAEGVLAMHPERDPLDSTERVELSLIAGDARAAAGDFSAARVRWREALLYAQRLLGEAHPHRRGIEERLTGAAPLDVSASASRP